MGDVMRDTDKRNEDSMRTMMLILALTCTAALSVTAAPAAREKRLPVPTTAPLAATTEAELAAVLKSDAQLKDKIDACREIGRVGTAASVPVIAALLANPELSHMARVALEMIPGQASTDALLAALGTTTGALRVGVAGSLGQRRVLEAVPALSGFLKDADPVLAATSAKALGRIGGADAVKALEGALSSAAEPLRAAIGEGLLRCADSAGSDRAGRAIFDRIRAAPVSPTVRCAALRGSILTRGDDGVPLIVETLRGTNGVEITVALRAAHELPGSGATKQLAAALPSLPAAIRPSMVTLLGARGDAVAAPALIEVAKATGDSALRVGAIGALVMTSAEASVPVLAGLALDGDTNIAAAARSALGSIPGRKADSAVLALLDDKDAAVRAVAVELIAQRAPEGSGARLLKAAADSDEKVRVASLRALRACATVEDIPALLALLSKSGAGAESQAAEGSLAAVCAREVRKTPARVTIVKAVYGALPDGKSADVTAKVQELIKGGTTSFEPGNRLFGDPAGGSVKSFSVTYSANGMQSTRTVRENETIAFPAVAADPPCSAALLKALPSAPAPAKIALLRVLGSTGGPKAFEAIRTASAGGEAEVRGVAMRLLCEWPTALALPVLQETAKTATDATVKLLALRGAIRLAPQTDQAPAAKLAALAELGGLVTRDDERKIMLAALGEIATPEALALVMKDIGVPALKDEAAAAAVNIGERIVKTHAAAVAEAMKKVNSATDNKQIKRRVATLIRDTKPQ